MPSLLPASRAKLLDRRLLRLTPTQQGPMMPKHLTAFVLLLTAGTTHAWADAPTLDLTRAVVTVRGEWPTSGPAVKAVAMLIEEVEKRTQVRWDLQDNNKINPGFDGPEIVIGF